MNAGVKIVPAGLALDHMNGMVHLNGDTIKIDSVVARSGGPEIRLSGTVGIGTLANP